MLMTLLSWQIDYSAIQIDNPSTHEHIIHPSVGLGLAPRKCSSVRRLHECVRSSVDFGRKCPLVRRLPESSRSSVGFPKVSVRPSVAFTNVSVAPTTSGESVRWLPESFGPSIAFTNVSVRPPTSRKFPFVRRLPEGFRSFFGFSVGPSVTHVLHTNMNCKRTWYWTQGGQKRNQDATVCKDMLLVWVWWEAKRAYVNAVNTATTYIRSPPWAAMGENSLVFFLQAQYYRWWPWVVLHRGLDD